MYRHRNLIRFIQPNNHITFVTDPNFEIQDQKQQYNYFLHGKVEPQYLYLFNTTYKFDIFEYIPRLFTITTKNNISHKFNIFLLKLTSPTISNFIQNNPNQLTYQLDIIDDQNVLGKYSDMYLGKKVIFTESELPTAQLITKNLRICCPNYLRSDNPPNSKIDLSKGVGMGIENSIQFFTLGSDKKFIIETNKKEYQCNFYGVYSSKVIREFIQNNPTAEKYVYNYEDNFDEFQLICDVFNFCEVGITVNNMDSLKEIIDDLQITYLDDKINSYVNDYEKVSRTIDDHQNVIDSIETLFDWLFNLQNYTVERVKDLIIESPWIESEENVQELVAFILQVIRTDFKYHTQLIELIIQLDKESLENEQLKIFLPFFIKKLLFYMGEKNTICSFIYNLYKRGLISKSELFNSISEALDESRTNYNKYASDIYVGIQIDDRPIISINSLYSWFLPEIVALKKYDDELTIKKGQIFVNFINTYYPNNLEEYKIMRDRGEPDDQLTKALRNDDVDTFQDFLAKNGFHSQENENQKQKPFFKYSMFQRNQTNVLQFTVPYNIFEDFVINGQTKYIDYAAAYGSLKCFKYLLLNHGNINETTFRNAVYGGNIEIIKIVDQKTKNASKSSLSLYTNKERSEIDFPSIMKHQNDLFDWILQEKYIKQMSQSNNTDFQESLLKSAAKNGNAHALIEMIDKGNDYLSLTKFIIQLSSQNGFYHLAQLFNDLISKKSDNDNEHSNLFGPTYLPCIPFVSFGNLAIFKLYCKQIRIPKEYENSLELAVKRDFQSIIDFCFENLFKENTKITHDSVFKCLNIAISKNDKNRMFKYLLHHFQLANSNVFKGFKKFNNLLSKACYLGNFEITKILTELIIQYEPRELFTRPFFNAAISNSLEICRFFVDEKVPINYEKLSCQISKLSTIDEKIFELIVNHCDSESKQVFLNCYLDTSISKNNKNLIQYLFKENVYSEDALFKAISNHDLDLVNIILDKNKNDLTFINKKSKNGTALSFAVKINDLPIVKRLLSIPGIDPNLYGEGNKTPLLLSISNLNLKILNEILAFYGENIRSQKWQLNKALKMTLKLISSKSKATTPYWTNKASTSAASNPCMPNLMNDKKANKKASILSIVMRLLEIDCIDYNIYSGNYTILSYACEINEIEIVQMLLNSNKVDVNLYSPSSGNTPLITAIDYKNIEIAKLLIEYPKTDINAKNYLDQTALTIAVDKQLCELIDILLKNDNFDAEKINLNYAFYISTGETSKFLISAKNLDVNYRLTKDNIASSSSQINASNSSEKNWKYSNHWNSYSSYSNSKVNSKKNSEFCELEEINLFKTILIDAVNNNDIEKVDLIIQHKSFNKDKSQLKKALFMSVVNKNIGIFRKLLPLIEDVNIYGIESDFLIKIAVQDGTKEIVSDILYNSTFNSVKSELLEAFVDSYENQTDESVQIMDEIYNYDKENDKLIDFNNLLPNGKSFFTSIGIVSNQIGDKNYAINNTSGLLKVGDVVKFFLDHGVDPNKPDDDAFYPLEHAIILDSLEFVQVLLNSNKVDFSLNIPVKGGFYYLLAQQYEDSLCESDSKYKSYLHLAARSRNPKILEELLNRNLVDINIEDDLGETPLMEACRFNQIQNIVILFKHDNLDYLHKNSEGQDAINICEDIFDIKKNCSRKSKEDYLQILISFLKEEEEEDYGTGIRLFGNYSSEEDYDNENDDDYDIEVD